MSLSKGKMVSLAYQYDFAKQGGAVGAITLSPAVDDGKSSGVEEGFVVTGWSLHVEGAVASGGTPTITFGPSSDSDGYAADVFALVGSDNAMVARGQVAGDLVWENTAKHDIHFRVGSAANTQDVVMTVGTAALTAGKLKFYVFGYRDFS